MAVAKSARANELVAHYLELFEQIGAVQPKLVFGEHAFFFQGVMFALIWDGVLYVRVDATSRPKHEALGLKPFVYVNREGRGTAMPYFEVPVAALDDADEMSAWARPAIAAALAASAKKKPSGTKAKISASEKPSAKKSRARKPAVKKPAAKKPSAKKAKAKAFAKAPPPARAVQSVGKAKAAARRR